MILLPVLALAALPAFPGAEGFGAYVTGGRGGKVIKVSTLACTGPGSFTEALEGDSDPRIIVFTVSGVIDCSARGSGVSRAAIEPSAGDVTIAGQTAPGGGITLYGRLLFHGLENIIIRHLRVRHPTTAETPGLAGNQKDALRISTGSRRFIVDHVSLAYGGDETFDLYESNTGTVQWSTLEDADPSAGHAEANHNYGMLMYDPDGIGAYSVHHNLFAHVRKRAPAVNQGPAEVINNLVYNAQLAYHHDNPAGGAFNLIGNRMKAGPNNTSQDPSPLYFDNDGIAVMTSADGGAFVSQLYVDAPGFFVGLDDAPRAFPSIADAQDTNADASWYQASAYDFCGNTNYIPPRTDAVDTNEALVLARAGAFPRDAVTTRIITEYNARTGGWGYQPNERLNATTLMTGLTATAAPADTDDDGMADSWEPAHGLTVGVDDHNFTQPSGYTAIEDYLNALADALVPARSSTLCNGTVIGPTGTTGLPGPTGVTAATGTPETTGPSEPAPSGSQTPGGNETYPRKAGCACGSAGDASMWIFALLLTLLRLRWHARARHEVH